MSFRRLNPTYRGPDFPLNVRQARAVPTLKDQGQLLEVSKKIQRSFADVQKTPNPPAKAINVSGASLTTAGVTISWAQVRSPSTDGYVVQRSSDGSFQSNLVEFNVHNPLTTTFNDMIPSGSTAFYRIITTAGSSHQPQFVRSLPSLVVKVTAL